MTRILGIDYGTKHIGVAISDPQAVFGQPHSVIKNSTTTKNDVITKILDIVKTEQVTKIVLGESKNFKGQDNVVMPAIRDFKKALEDALKFLLPLSVEVIFEPEFLTSYQAGYFQGKTDLLDASAAALILQSYLDKKNNREKVIQKD
jgi:putative holliday junction resolvase